MKTVGLIFPHQLFENHPVLKYTQTVYLIEDSLFFGDPHTNVNFHKQKLVFHRASMRSFQSQLESQGFDVHYIEYQTNTTIVGLTLSLENTKVICVDPTDYLLERRLKRRFGDKLTLLESPLFINTKQDNKNYLENGKLFMQEFYKHQRTRLNILMDAEGPVGGRWSFDGENRKKIPQSHYSNIPADPTKIDNEYISKAIEYVNKKFPNNPGSLENFTYKIDHIGAHQALVEFCRERLHLFGDYEDAIVADQSRLYHSLLSPYLNIGLLKPMDVVNIIIQYGKEHEIQINNIEGFVRQIIGWREFIRMTYEHHGVSMRTHNIWKHTRTLEAAWYNGSTGLDPVDQTIQKTLNTAYAHHIERLMILGNAMFLCQINPNEVYRWFMEMYIDAYDWVMVPNVYGMTQSAQKGLVTTKPYISGSNYIKKMSDYKNGDWVEIWDALYWDTVITHLDELTANGRMHFVTARAAKFTSEQKQVYAEKAKAFRDSLEGV